MLAAADITGLTAIGLLCLEMLEVNPVFWAPSVVGLIAAPAVVNKDCWVLDWLVCENIFLIIIRPS